VTYHYSENGAARGPVSVDELVGLVKSGHLPEGVMVCEAGGTQWRRMGDFPELRFSLNSKPGDRGELEAPVGLGNREVLDSRESPSSTVEVLAYQKLSGSDDVEVARNIYAAYRAGMRLKQVRATLREGEVVVEAGCLHYMRGQFEVEASSGGAGKWLKSKMSGESTVKPRYRGTGVIHLEPSFGHFLLIDLNDEEWVVDQGAFYASEGAVDVDAVIQSNISSALFGGEGLFQTRISGSGWAILSSPVPMDEIVVVELNNEKLQVDGSFALARKGRIDFSVEKSGKSLWKSVRGGEGLLQTFQGSGEVWLAPTQSVYEAVRMGGAAGIRELAGTEGKSDNS
tara:strand:+ start:202 stop:1224 length:1023 start_codon:yes stop_codon:yes gene_type:complete